MPRQPSIFYKIRKFFLGSKTEKKDDFAEEVGICAKCEIRALFIKELKKRFEDEREGFRHALDMSANVSNGLSLQERYQRWKQLKRGGLVG